MKPGKGRKRGGVKEKVGSKGMKKGGGERT